mmetsp:Transcript_21085/g.61301  ORF Transcript_21085/g.61301 Transcript_21085/m.61301 type:complete len:90 (+) Transcript_21085:139-408(+)
MNIEATVEVIYYIDLRTEFTSATMVGGISTVRVRGREGNALYPALRKGTRKGGVQYREKGTRKDNGERERLIGPSIYTEHMNVLLAREG